MVRSARGRWENWSDIKILVSETPPEIVPTWPSKADFAIRVAHKSGLEGRHVRAQILKRSDCQLLEHFLSAHVFPLNMIQFSYDLHFGLITDFRRIANHAGMHCVHRNATSRFTLPHSLADAIAPRRYNCDFPVVLYGSNC